MSRIEPESVEVIAAAPPLRPFDVRLHPRVEIDLGIQELLERLEELHWFVAQYRRLTHWPADAAMVLRIEDCLGLERHECGMNNIYESTFDRPQRTPLFVFFWVAETDKTVWILHVCEGLPFIRHSKLRRAQSRLREIKGYYQDRRLAEPDL